MKSILHRYRGLVCDLDGVVYRGDQAVPHAVEALNDARAQGVPAVYATNNASRTPGDVGTHLRRLGVDTEDRMVLTSSLVGAQHLADLLPAGARVLAVGGPGVTVALEAVGLCAVDPAADATAGEDPVAAVLQGYGPDVRARDRAQAAYAIEQGARWVATNLDLTLPTEFGIAPGNGSLVGAVRNAAGIDPEAVGKPGPMMYEMAADLLGTHAGDTLGVGDRLETDIAGAHAAGMDALLVLTGVHGPTELVGAPAGQRPRYVVADLRALAAPYDEPARDGDGWVCGTTRARVTDGRLRLDSPGTTDRMTAVRVALAALWAALDTGDMDPEQARAALSAARLDTTAMRAGDPERSDERPGRAPTGRNS